MGGRRLVIITLLCLIVGGLNKQGMGTLVKIHKMGVHNQVNFVATSNNALNARGPK